MRLHELQKRCQQAMKKAEKKMIRDSAMKIRRETFTAMLDTILDKICQKAFRMNSGPTFVITIQ